MMQSQYSISIEPKVYAMLEQEGREERRDTSEIVNDLLRRHLLLKRMKQMEKVFEPLAREAGYRSEEDVFRDVS
jgi:predicted CopG family antitoxin